MANYIPDPNDSTKQVPVPKSSNWKQWVSYAECPAAGSTTKAPSYVVITNSGSFKFQYGGTSNAYITGSVRQDASTVHPGPIKLDINPISWQKSDGAAAVGDVIFVYRRNS